MEQSYKQVMHGFRIRPSLCTYTALAASKEAFSALFFNDSHKLGFTETNLYMIYIGGLQ